MAEERSPYNWIKAGCGEQLLAGKLALMSKPTPTIDSKTTPTIDFFS
ncbi:hypothetical protein MC7420_6350 [Coleofasciculus chthonoplastes PCC 7420]|uniref:Uncharacterized protein n=1 Tax=Coleofasciculus chthonoplastes PCC 7420 TaxID=118168 RepID=B4VQM3_9CYAN|nr:hypothetical protein MC7420_6350 [Coleofasciculus chthonoplastes PCC 7420]